MSTIACLKNNIGIRDHPSEMVLPNSNVCVTPEEAETIRSGNAEVLKVHVLKTTGRRKRSEHRKYDLKQRAKIGKWVCDFGNIGAVRHFTSEFGKPINESTVIFMRKKNTIYRKLILDQTKELHNYTRVNVEDCLFIKTIILKLR